MAMDYELNFHSLVDFTLKVNIGEGNSAFFDNTGFTLLTIKGIPGMPKPEAPAGCADMLRTGMASSPVLQSYLKDNGSLEEQLTSMVLGLPVKQNGLTRAGSHTHSFHFPITLSCGQFSSVIFHK